MSDNWNLLAKLLGTPTPTPPPEPPAETKSDNNPSQSDDSAASAATDEVVADAKPDSVEPDAPKVNESEEIDADELIAALSSSVESSSLPGFGVSDPDPAIEELAAGGPPPEVEPVVESLLETNREQTASDRVFSETVADETTQVEEAAEEVSEVDSQAWGDLASELGIEVEAEDTPHRESASTPEPSPPKTIRKPKPTKKRGSFGDGLGLDLGDDPVDESGPEETSVEA
ncbi:MAG: hypothetical protein AAGJ83_09235, partial [Planctomycetota bacterium]